MLPAGLAAWAALCLLAAVVGAAGPPCASEECLAAEVESLVEEVEAAETAALRMELLQVSPVAVGRRSAAGSNEADRPAVAAIGASGAEGGAQELVADGGSVGDPQVAASRKSSMIEAAALQFRQADKDADGLLTESELLEALVGGAEDGPLLTEAKWRELFTLLDTDGSGLLEEEEAVSAAVRLAQGGQETAGGKKAHGDEVAQAQELALLMKGRAARNSTRTRLALVLDEALTWKAEDPRCARAPEGWLCLSSNTMIYCSAKKRLYDQRSCGWKGTCQAGILGSAGCYEPMCMGRESGGSYCSPEGVYNCYTNNNNGRVEIAATFQQPCKQCMGFPDGPPPSRRRRTCNGGMDCSWCYFSSNNNNCYSDSEDPAWATCV